MDSATSGPICRSGENTALYVGVIKEQARVPGRFDEPQLPIRFRRADSLSAGMRWEGI